MSKEMQSRAAVTSAKALRAGQLEDQRKFHNPNMDQEDKGGSGWQSQHGAPESSCWGRFWPLRPF